MNRVPALTALAVAASAAFTAPALAADSGAFIVSLGQDTTSVERFTRSDSRVEVFQVGRSPRVLQRHFTSDYANGALSRLAMVVTPPGSTTPTQTIEANVGPDSIRIQTTTGTAPAQSSSVPFPAGTQVVTNSSPWTGYETQTMKLAKSGKDSLSGPLYFIGAGSLNRFSLARVGSDSMEIRNDRGDVFRARVDRSGRILGVLPVAGTSMFSVVRVETLDENAMAAEYAAREKGGAGLGTLSPRDTVTATAGGASLWFDYGRPSKRGRVIFGNVVPFGAVWRTGANAATQFKTDKALDFGGVSVPAGFYTLWTIPSETGWKLIINSETGQSGTARKPEKDLATIDMTARALPAVVERFTISVEATEKGGVLNLDWDTTRASAAFTVRE